jgi:hypothetical protein
MKTNCLLLLIFLYLEASPCQEIGIVASQTWTDNAELQNPVGFGVYLATNPSKPICFRITYEYLSNRRVYEGFMVGGQLPTNAVFEQIQSSSHANLWKLNLLAVPLQYRSTSFAIGAVMSTNFYSGNKKGALTGKSFDSINGQKFGIGYVFQIHIFPLESLPIAIGISASREFLGYSNMATDTDAPFAASMSTTNIQLAAGYSF